MAERTPAGGTGLTSGSTGRSAAACPADDELERYDRGELSTAAAEAVGGHAATCPACDERLRSLRDDRALLDDLRLAVQRVSDAGSADPALLPSISLRSFGPYDIRDLLGTGGMGRVFRAVHRQSGQEVALKLLRTEQQVSEEFRVRFAREGKAMTALDHPNILRVYDCPVQGRQTALAMELALGGSLAARLADCRPAGRTIPEADIMNWSLQAARGLGAAHSRGWVHRDIKPSNLLFDANGNLKIADFGVAQALDSTTWVTGTGHQVGTPAYMSPEQCRGERATPASDVYSLGVTMYEMATGRLPFEVEGGSPFALMLKQMSDPVPHPVRFNALLSERVSSMILRCLEKLPEDRYRNGDELCAALDLARRPPPPAASPTPAGERAKTLFNAALVREQLERLPQRSIVAWACRCARYVQSLNSDPRVEAALGLAESFAFGTDGPQDRAASSRILARMQSLRAASLAAAYAEVDAGDAAGAAARAAAAAGACGAARCLADAAADAVFALENAITACRKAGLPVSAFWKGAQSDYRKLANARFGAAGAVGQPLPAGFWA